jgi:phosphatidylserine/phosphatidylglycerophosphate/cardiolipin synthase-like enzyme
MLDRIDAAIGATVEREIANHHRRRLGNIGQGHVFADHDDLWVSPGRDPRPGNGIDVLIDGDDALGSMLDALLAAKSHVQIAGWHATPDFKMSRVPGVGNLRSVLAELAERVPVRVLLWAGPPLPVFEPSRRLAKRVRRQFTEGSAVECVLDARERTMHCHHEKIIVVDDTVAFVGGIDLTNLSADRWDRSAHEPRGAINWHDVATRLTGPIVADVAEHFRQRWSEVAGGEQLPPPRVPSPVPGGVTIQMIRTVPERVYRFAAKGEFSILDAYLRGLRSAERLIYLENQFLWSTEIVRVLVDKLRHPPSPDFRMVLVLPTRPRSGRDTTRGQLGCLIDADSGRGHLLATTLTAHDRQRSDPLYVHAKVGIIDDAWLTIGSANLNEHSLFNDTEVNVLVRDGALARETRLRLWAEHLEQPTTAIDGDPTTVIDTLWKPMSRQQSARIQASMTPDRRLARLPALSRRSERLMGPAKGLLVDG